MKLEWDEGLQRTIFNDDIAGTTSVLVPKKEYQIMVADLASYENFVGQLPTSSSDLFPEMEVCENCNERGDIRYFEYFEEEGDEWAYSGHSCQTCWGNSEYNTPNQPAWDTLKKAGEYDD